MSPFDARIEVSAFSDGRSFSAVVSDKLIVCAFIVLIWRVKSIKQNENRFTFFVFWARGFISHQLLAILYGLLTSIQFLV